MNTTHRRPIIVGNWKMNTTPDEGGPLADAVCNLSGDLTALDLVLCPPYMGLHAVSERLKGSGIGLGAQNMHWESEGAYTGEISARMLLTAGCSHVILGHSERRTILGETDEIVNLKAHHALATGLTPILCVGETLEEREAGRTQQVVTVQVHEGLSGITADQLRQIVLAYEPIWAIGTGRVATPDQANHVHGTIRCLLEDMAGADVATSVRIQYGGSVKPENATDLLSQPDIDGALVGGASLAADSFVGIARAAV